MNLTAGSLTNSLANSLARWFGADRENIDREALAVVNRSMETLPAQQRIEQAVELLPATHVLSSSFGAQSAVMLHMVNQVVPGIPVILVDTGYLFPETYLFIDELRERLHLNLQVRRSPLSPGWLEARHGRLWERGLEGIETYNALTKVEPMQQALRELQAGTWISGLRRAQSTTRARLPLLEIRDGRFKFHPLYDWTDRDIGRYLKSHELPYHPLWDQGYVSIGDWHTTRPLSEVDSVEQTRFLGLKRECGLHGLDG